MFVTSQVDTEVFDVLAKETGKTKDQARRFSLAWLCHCLYGQPLLRTAFEGKVLTVLPAAAVRMGQNRD